MKLDRIIAKHQSLGRKQARQRIIDGRVCVNGCVTLSHDLEVNRFSKVTLDGDLLFEPPARLRVMLYKPVGILSATKDAQFTTVIDLLDGLDQECLHLAGRLDRGTSGMVLLTNDGTWSKALMHPDHKVPKGYLVETAEPIATDAVALFARGFYFHTEDITTMPAVLEILTEHKARLTLHEGRYHQVKRMFHRIDNRVVSLHRESIGGLRLPDDWLPGQWKLLDNAEAQLALLHSAPARPQVS